MSDRPTTLPYAEPKTPARGPSIAGAFASAWAVGLIAWGLVLRYQIGASEEVTAVQCLGTLLVGGLGTACVVAAPRPKRERRVFAFLLTLIAFPFAAIGVAVVVLLAG